MAGHQQVWGAGMVRHQGRWWSVLLRCLLPGAKQHARTLPISITPVPLGGVCLVFGGVGLVPFTKLAGVEPPDPPPGLAFLGSLG